MLGSIELKGLNVAPGAPGAVVLGRIRLRGSLILPTLSVTVQIEAIDKKLRFAIDQREL